MDCLQGCRNKKRMAEISVPAWPMPIHQTKFTIAKPHATGMLIPQIPTPRTKSQETAVNKTIVPTNPASAVATQAFGVWRVRTMPLILSVSVV